MESLRSLRIEPGTPVIATIKAPLVNVLRNSGNPIGSARNRLAATVLRVAESPVIAEITGRLEDGSEVCALVSATTARVLNLQSGDTAEFWFKGFSVVLNTMQS
jgi:molybdate transport system regulatory protein